MAAGAQPGGRVSSREYAGEHRSVSRADVATDKPVAYMRQLCKHFGHKVDASFDDDSGHIQFEFGRCELHATAER